jgi:hypothetical protein
MRIARLIAVVVLVLSLGTPAQGDAPHEDFGPDPNAGDCRDFPPPCIQDPWTGKLTISPHVVREGEAVTMTVTLEPGGVSFSLPNDNKSGRDCDVRKESRNIEVQNADGRWERADQDVPTSATCTIHPGSTNWQWVTPQAGITGPCGSQIAVQEGRAEYASCAGTYASDYFGVIPKDSDTYGISGHIRLSNGRGMSGVPVTLAGPDPGSTVTSATGDYYFLAKKGSYTVSASADVCAEPVSADCSHTREIQVGPSTTVNFRPRGEGRIEGTLTGPDSKPKSGALVRIVGRDGTTVTTDGQGHYEATLPKGRYVVSATSLESAVAPSTTPTTTYYCADNSGKAGKECEHVVSVDVPPDTKLNWKTEKDPDDIQVSLEGGDVVGGQTFSITMTVTNPRDVTLDTVTFADGPGLGLQKVHGVGTEPVVLVKGPSAPLPVALAPHQTKTLKYQLATGDYGDELVNVNVQGMDPDKKAVHGSQGMTVSVTQRQPTKEDLKGLTVEGINDILDLAAENDRKVTAAIGKSMSEHLGLPEPTAGDRAAAAMMGLPPEMAGVLAQRRAEQEAFWSGYGEEFKTRVDAFGTSGGQFLSNAYDTLSEPEGRRQLSEKLVEGAGSLGKASLENLGYLGQAYLATYTPEGAQTIIDSNAELAKQTVQVLGEVATGIPEVMAENDRAYKKDPIAYNRAAGKEWGGASFEGVKEAALGALGEAGVRGIAAVAPKALEAVGLKRVTSLGDEVAETTGVVEGADSTGAAARRLELAERANATVQELPYGEVLDDAALVGKGGIRPTDARELESIVKDVNEKFGVDFELGARTSEPLSAGIDGVAKREYIKPKAVSAIDKLLGAEESLQGRASVFKPKLPSQHVLEGLERRQPGIRAKIQSRFNDQQKLWTEFQDPNSGLRQLVDGSTKTGLDGTSLLHPDGITAVVERPGSTFPKELGKRAGTPDFAYLEQLDDPEFLRVRGISTDEAKAFKDQISKFPDSARTRIVTEDVNGTTTFREGIKDKPIVSDLDLEYARPKDGKWPSGKRGQIEAYVNSRLKKIGRFPEHGWSDAALDVPSDYFEVAAKFKLGTTLPSNAKKAADDLVRQFKSMGKALRDRAVLEPSEAVRKALLAKAEKFEGVTADYLLKKYPPGEKIIIFSEKAGPTVGSSTGGR